MAKRKLVESKLEQCSGKALSLKKPHLANGHRVTEHQASLNS